MKFSIAASVVILAIGGVLGLKHQRRLTSLHGEVQALTTKAEKLGIAIELAESPVTKRQREDRSDDARAVAVAMIAFAKEMDKYEKVGGKPDEEFEKRGLEMQNRMMQLDATQLKIVIAGLRGDPSISDDTRQNLICYSIAMIGEDHPAAALAIFSESSDLLGDSLTGPSVIAATLGSWAKNNPLAALDWVRKNAEAHPEIADDDAKLSIIAGAAVNDPQLAFKLIGEAQLDDPSSAIQSLVEVGKTPEQRTAILDALRAHLATMPEDERVDVLHESLESMGRNITDEGFDSVQSWIRKSQLTPEESAQFAAGLSYFNTKQDTGRWIDWLGENLPKEHVAENVDNLIGQWTQQDYLAAGKWLSAAADGPAKQAAISAYAETVAEYEPQTAVQWALTLPSGEARDSTLQAIYQNWPKSDADAAAAFAKEHGIDTEVEE